MDAGSSANTNSIFPESTDFSLFLIFKTGSGHNKPVASISLSCIMAREINLFFLLVYTVSRPQITNKFFLM